MPDDSSNTRIPNDADMPVLAAWMEMWMWPITMMARLMNPGSINPFGLNMNSDLVDDEPEADRDVEGGQLPVPNPIRNSKEHDIFA
ncbi:hypothetical protein RM533_05410 [Croceicoccus sp. F390]|uniref:Uncharacterized protein n=1 Tax=Croceicoccus esteveae TaxID=3075597 RepID=A0ABU2ZHD4_9SPHN|nr:hypothetical protein [Croceicoccus sp. F390]MDT0575616.1 hypothetical protein [Croceicoccus sp. F390]